MSHTNYHCWNRKRTEKNYLFIVSRAHGETCWFGISLEAKSLTNSDDLFTYREINSFSPRFFLKFLCMNI